jgi:hemolysin activation/secretion protein
MGRVEDLMLGLHYSIQFGRSFRAIGAYRDENHMSFNYRAGTSLGGPNYLILYGVAASRFRRESWEQSVWTNSVNFYSKLLPHQVLAARIFSQFGNNLDPWSRFYLGGTDGLRGYRAWEFRGKKASFLFNLESRLYAGREFLTVSPGLVAFFDCGTVWDRDNPIRSRDLHLDYGAGLRLGMNKLPGSMVLRLDYAIPLDPGRKPYFSFGQGQVF